MRKLPIAILLVLLLVAVAVRQVAESREEIASQRNAYIEREIAKLGREVAEIGDLKEIASLYDAMARTADRVQQQNTVYAAEALAELSHLPRQIVLTGVVAEKDRLAFTGEAATASALDQLQPALEQGRFVTQVRVVEGAPAGGKHRFRVEAKLATPSPFPVAPAGKQQ